MYINLNRPMVRKNNFNKILNELAHDFFSELKPMSVRPLANIVEGNDDYKIQWSLPGLAKKDLQIKIENNLLTVQSVKEVSEGEIKYVRKEFDYSKFKRTFKLPKTVNPEGISAKMEKGILLLTLPKKEEAKEQPPREINIK